MANPITPIKNEAQKEIVLDEQGLTALEAEEDKHRALEKTKDTTDRIFQTIENLQKNGTNISGMVEQIQKLSGLDRFEKLEAIITADTNASPEQIVDRWERVEDKYMQLQDHAVDEVIKCQNAITRNTVTIVDSCKDALIVIGVCSLAGVIIFTPGGRHIASLALKAVQRLPA